ncbi:hypothetical protein RUND412_001498 [Rhizina undulata]
MLNAPPPYRDSIKLDNKYFDSMPSSSRSPFANFQYGYFAASFNSPPAPAGQPLLDPQEQNEFETWFDNIGSGGMPTIDSSHLFAPDLSKEYPHWPEGISQNYQASVPNLLPHHGYLGNGVNEYQSPVSPAPPLVTSQMELNPFNGSHELINHQQQQQQQQHHHHPSPHMTAHSLLNFGTDTNFAPNGYHPPPHPSVLDKEVEIRSKVFSAFSKEESAMTTAVNSPAEIKYERIGGEETEEDDSTPFRDEDTTPSPSRSGSAAKRRAEGADDLNYLKASRKARTRRTEPNSKSSKKKTPGSKRDNLSEAQKRENHIHSEQKRRNLIRQGFEDLCALVPELRSGGYSKSAVLAHAANYLDELKRGNAKLRVYLQQLESARAY